MNVEHNGLSGLPTTEPPVALGIEDQPEARAVTLLLLEDSDLDALLVEHALEAATESGLYHKYTSRRARTLAEAREILAQEQFDIIIVDLWVPDSHGLATLSAVRDVARGAALLVVTSQDGHRSAREALRLGAQDYLVKGEFTFPSLERAVRYALDRKVFEDERRRDQTERDQLQENLRQAQRMESLGRLAAGVAHDFNNVLTVILGHAQILHSAGSQEETEEGLREIRVAAERAARLTSQLLAFSRQQPSSPKVLNVNGVIADLESMLVRLIGEHIELVTRLAPALPNIRADRGHLEQLLMNLAINARDAMPDGGVLSVVTSPLVLDEEARRLQPYVRVGPYVKLSVSDTGVGMDESVRVRIFEPFFTTKEIGQGTGLGLSTVYGIVKQSDGYIWCTSVPGMGTRFDVLLPATRAPEEHAAPAIRESRAVAGARILVAEDDPAVRAIVLRMLRSAGYVALEAASGIQALSILDGLEEPVDALVTDMVLPGMTGRELAARVAARVPDIQVVYMSGYTDDEMVRRGELPSHHLFLQKPFRGQQLLETVDTALGRRAG